uniref:Golgi transport 1B n=1 Tax=Phasianus colchicus TaxID=9054 RepID=A0A669Q2C5_PHACC
RVPHLPRPVTEPQRPRAQPLAAPRYAPLPRGRTYPTLPRPPICQPAPKLRPSSVPYFRCRLPSANRLQRDERECYHVLPSSPIRADVTSLPLGGTKAEGRSHSNKAAANWAPPRQSALSFQPAARRRGLRVSGRRGRCRSAAAVRLFLLPRCRPAATMISLSDTQKIGMGLTGFGVFFLFFGMILFFDKALLAIGNVLFVAGLAFVIGLERTFRFFFQKHKMKATGFFLGGVLIVLIGWPLIGMILEIYGFFLLFRGFFPVVIGFIRRVPVLGSLLNLPGISSLVDKVGESNNMV